MKKSLYSIFIIICLFILTSFGDNDFHSTGGAPAGHSGDPFSGNKTCNTSGCHTGPTVGTLTGIFSSNVPPAGYTPGATYTITAAFVRPGHNEFGFQATPQNVSGTKLGALAVLNTQTQLVGSGGRYVTHTNTGISGSGSKTWNFQWIAPATGQGPVTIYGAFNATNNNNSVSGDSVFNSTLVITEAPASVNEFYENPLALSISPNPVYGHAACTFSLLEAADTKGELLHLDGTRVVPLFSEKLVSGDQKQLIDLSTVAPGIYFLRVSTGNTSSVRKIVKL